MLHVLLELLASEDLAVGSVRGVAVVWEGLWGLCGMSCRDWAVYARVLGFLG